jgi:uncharacterized protein involved in exopolysaccharide biosynthesis
MQDVATPDSRGDRFAMPDMIARTDRNDGDAPSREYAFHVYPLTDADEIRLSELWRLLWRRRWVVLSIAAGGGILGLIAALLITPVYRSEVLVAPAAESSSASGLSALAGQFADVAALAGINLSAGNSTAEAMATLRSRAFTARFIRERGLMPVLFADDWDEDRRAWRVASDDAPTMEDAYRLLDSIRSVDEDLSTGLITVTVTWGDPKLAADWANALVEDVNEQLRDRAILDSRKNLEFLNAELETVEEIEVRTAIYGLIEAEMKNAMFANARSEYAFKVIDPAVVPEKKHWPNRLLLVLIGLAAGAVIGVLVVAALRTADDARKIRATD